MFSSKFVLLQANSDDSSNMSSIHVPVPTYHQLPSPKSRIPEGASDSSSTNSSSGQSGRYSGISLDRSYSGISQNRSDVGHSHNPSNSDSDSPSGINSESDDKENGERVVTQLLYRGSNKSTDEAVVALMDLFIKKRWKVESLSVFPKQHAQNYL